MPPTSDKQGPKIVQWILDTRPLWPVPRKEKSKDEVSELRNVASQAFALLPESQQTDVLKYYHLRDAKMSLASHLLKRLVIAKYCNVSWSKIVLSKSGNGKPCFVAPPDGDSHVSIDFNVSHQAGIVSLIAAIGFESKVDTGTDVVCVNEREKRDAETIQKSGFNEWVNMYAEVFAPSEVSFMKNGFFQLGDLGIEGKYFNENGKDALLGCERGYGKISVKTKRGDAEDHVEVNCAKVIDFKMRRFYAMWCLRETFVKMTGEALLASWLKELEIWGARGPPERQGIVDDDSLEPGDIEDNFRIIFKGNQVTNVKMSLSALGKGYMVGGALRTGNAAEQKFMVLGKWEELDLDRDVLIVAESSL